MPINTDVETRMSCFSHKEFKNKEYCKKYCCFIEQDLCSMATDERIEREIEEKLDIPARHLITGKSIEE